MRRSLGVGNAYRGDDAVGPAVAGRVRERAPELEVVVREQEPIQLLEAWWEPTWRCSSTRSRRARSRGRCTGWMRPRSRCRRR